MENNKRNEEQDQPKRKITAAELDALTGSATERVRSRKAGGDLGATGTNVSYEGATSTSATGTGYNSGQSGTGSDISREAEEDARTRASNPRENTNARTEDTDDRRMGEDDEKPDTVGQP